MKKVPERACTGCGVSKPKQELLRIVKDKENNISIDLTGKKNGRGAYICTDVKCIDKLIKSNRLAKVFECNISNEFYEDLRDVVAKLSK